MNILIVDDSKAMRMIVRRSLRQTGYGDHPQEEAPNVDDALKLIDTFKPDLILSDWNMPDKSGLQFLQEARKAGCRAKFGFITSMNSPEMRAQAEASGASFFLTKPFTPETLKAEIDRISR